MSTQEKWTQIEREAASGWAAPLLRAIDQQINSELPNWIEDHLYKTGQLPNWLSRKSLCKTGHWVQSFVQDRELAEKWISADFVQDDPQWYQELSTRFAAGIARVFVLHGNINDYVFHPDNGYLPLVDFLIKQNEDKEEVYLYSLSQGVQRCRGDRPEGSSPGRSQQESQDLWLRVRNDFHFLDGLVRQPSDTGAVIIIEYLDKLFPAQGGELDRQFLLEMILRWAISAEVLNSRHQIIMTTPAADIIHQDLRNSSNKIDLIEIPRPDNKDRLKFLMALYAIHLHDLPHRGRSQRYSIPVDFDESFAQGSSSEALDQLANASSGLNRMGLEDLFLRSQVESDGILSLDYVNRRKRELLASESAGLLEVVEPRFGFNKVGGLGLIRHRLEDICKALGSSNSLVRQTIPMGILFLGPPGTGKTLVAEALAKESGRNFVKLGDIREMWVGQSERNLSLTLNLIKSMKPVVVFIDEIDQSEGRRSEGGDSGVSGRIFSKLLAFMSDTSLRGDVLWIGASNRPDMIDDAMKRAGRFDLKLPFFLPEAQERRYIFEVLLKAKDIPYTLEKADFDRLASQTEYCSGAEIEVIVNEALRTAIARMDDEAITVIMADFQSVLNIYNLEGAHKKYREMELKILEEIPFQEFWPERYKKREQS